MKKFRVVLHTKSKWDIQGCLDYISKRSPKGAATWLKRFEQSKEELEHHAELMQRAPESEYVDREIRQLVFKSTRGNSYRLLFTIVGDEVHILRVRGPGQDLLGAEEIPTDAR